MKQNNNKRIENILEQAEIFQNDNLGYENMSKEELKNLLEQLLSEMLDKFEKMIDELRDKCKTGTYEKIEDDYFEISYQDFEELKQKLEGLK